MADDQKEVRRFLRVEMHERTVFNRTYGPFLRLVAYRLFEAILNSPEATVVKLTNYDIDSFPFQKESPKTWRKVEVGFNRHEALLVGAMAMLRIRHLDDLPVVVHLYEKDQAAVLRIILRKEDHEQLHEFLRWLDRLEEAVHPLKGRLLQVSPNGVQFLPPQQIRRDDVFLPEELLEEVERGFLFLVEPGAVPDGLHHRAILFAGPPGVGKTLACKWLAGWVSATVLWTTPQTLWKAGARALLELARKLRPALLILEDLDVAAGQRDGASPLGDLLAQLDGFGSLHGVGIVATTNHPEMLDHALHPGTRPGRFQFLITIEAMEDSLRRRYVEYLLARSEVLPEPETRVIERIVNVTRGFTGAQVAALVQDLEMFWLWEEDQGRRCTLDSVLDEALHGRPSITRNLGFDLGSEPAGARLASSNEPVRSPGGFR